MPRPRVVLAMPPELVPRAFSELQWARLDAVADVLDRTPLASFSDDRAAELLAQCDVVLGHWGCPVLDEGALGLAPQLRLFAYAAGTVKQVVTPAVFERGITVTSGAAANAVPVAEFTIAAILFANKGVFLAREWFRDPRVQARRPRPVGNWGKRVGIIGASRVGRAVIERLRPFDLTPVVYDPYLTGDGARSLGAELVELDELMATSDVVSLHAPDVAATEGMIGAEQLDLMKDGAVFINTARGRLVDHEALARECATGRISAVLDVTHPEPLPEGHPLRSLPNVFLTPHVAGAQGSELVRLADAAIDEIERFARGEPPAWPVLATEWDRTA